MHKNNLVLYYPNIKISLSSSLDNLKELLDKYGFVMNLTSRYNGESKTYEDGYPIYHGTTWLTEDDEVVVHFYFNKLYKLESITITNKDSYFGETLVKSYKRKQEWLESVYGNAQSLIKNNAYSTFDYEWTFDSYNIKHFINDRFGDEEGIIFDLEKFNQ